MKHFFFFKVLFLSVFVFFAVHFFLSYLLFIVVIPTGTLQLSNVQGGDGTHTGGNTIVQYAQNQDGQQFFVPGELFRFC